MSTVVKPKSLNRAVIDGPVTLTVDSIRDTHDMPGLEDLFAVLGHNADGVYYAGEAEVVKGGARPGKDETWTFSDNGDDDSFPIAEQGEAELE